MALTILLVEPGEELRERVREILRKDGHRVWAFSTADSAAETLSESKVEPSLAMLTADDDPGMDHLLDVLKACSSQCQRVWISPPGGDEVDRLAASRRPRGLLARTGLEIEARTLAERVWQTRERGRVLVQAPPMIGKSPLMVEIADLLERIATGGASTVLITGETGTGKEVVARRLHALGPRSHGPFVEVDCASIPSNLLESELFGHEAGAFTDAQSAKVGLMELGQGGTVFLDEIGELDLTLQAKLLRVLDTRKLRRLGGREEIALDIHLVAATNRDLTEGARNGNFRSDLYYRLDVVRLELPPVRLRGEDAWLLAMHFLEEAARRIGRPPLGLNRGLKKQLLEYSWPGNVREIQNHMERLALLAPEATSVIERLDFPRNDQVESFHIDFSKGPVPWVMLERTALVEALRFSEGNVSEAARLLGMGRGALRYRMSRHGLSDSENIENEAMPRKKAA